LILQGKLEMLACYIASMQVSFPLVLFVIPACLVCHSDLFGIILKKDAGQASMTDRGRIADKPQ